MTLRGYLLITSQCQLTVLKEIWKYFSRGDIPLNSGFDPSLKSSKFILDYLTDDRAFIMPSGRLSKGLPLSKRSKEMSGLCTLHWKRFHSDCLIDYNFVIITFNLEWKKSWINKLFKHIKSIQWVKKDLTTEMLKIKIKLRSYWGN